MKGMPIATTRVVLVAPSLPENVGAVARAMRHFGLRELVLAEGELDPCHPRALTLSAGAEDLLRTARHVPSLEAALTGAVLVVGTTARAMPGVGRLPIRPDAAAALARAHGTAGPVALVFGTEKHGLSNEQLRRCHQVVTIPGEPEACLNLAQAATVCFYAWKLAALEAEAEARPLTAVAAAAGVEDLAERLVDFLVLRELVKPRERSRKAHTIRRVLSRAALDPDEAAMFMGLLRAALRDA